MNKGEYDIEQLPDDCQKAARKIGTENLINLSEALGGKYFYVPKKDNLLRYFDRSRIIEDRRLGMTLRQLADKYRVSVDTVRRILKNHS